ncbi:MAG TPA: tetratricopeptide repeat protein [Gemmatimonadetes bacterium]|nr:tetratricopeptide repeat protein [Gemmatimonadota bacterium]
MSESLNQQIDSLERIYMSELDPQGRAFVSLADTHRRLGDLDKALAVIRSGLDVHPDLASAHVVAGCVHRARRESGDATRAFERVLELDSENTLARAQIAELIDDQRAQAYRDKMAAKKLVEQSDDRALVAIENLAPGVPAEIQAPSTDEKPESARPLVAIETLAPRAPAETGPTGVDPGPAVAPALPPDAINRPLVPIAALAPDPVPESAAPVVPASSLAPEGTSEGGGGDVVPATPPAPVVTPEPDTGGMIGLAPIGEEIYTETLAELYAGQGAIEQAIETYRKMLDFEPGNETFRRRIDELESVGLAAAPGPDQRRTVPIESLAPDGDAGDGTAGDALPWLSQP